MEERSKLLAAAKSRLTGGDAAAAAALLQNAVDADTRWGRAWLLLGQAQHVCGKYDDAALSFMRASSECCHDWSTALCTAAAENAQLAYQRIIPRHCLAWLNDEARVAVWRAALRRLRRRPCEAVLIAGNSGASAVEYCRLAVLEGLQRASAVTNSRLVAALAGSTALMSLPEELRARAEAVSRLDELPNMSYDALVWDWCNVLDAASVAAFCAARARCSADAVVVPARVRVMAVAVESENLFLTNTLPEGRVRVDEQGGFVELPHFCAAYTRQRRACQLQVRSCAWRALTAPVALLTVDASALASAECMPAGGWVDAPVIADGDACAIVTWLECDGFVQNDGEEGDAPGLTCAPAAELVTGSSRMVMSRAHAVQHATFAALPWKLAAGSTLRLRGAVDADGVCVVLDLPCVAPSPIAASIPEYHASMLNDVPRNIAFAAGIVAAVASFRKRHGRAPRVLDIGAGSGLLSICAARAGASEVVACERDAALAAVASADVEHNGLSDRITVVAANSRELERSAFGMFDLIVSEILGSDPLAENVLPTLAHAQHSLLAPHGAFVPARIVIHAAWASRGALAQATTPAASSFRVIEPLRTSCHLPDVPDAAMLSSTAEFPPIDFNARPLATQGKQSAVVHALSSGQADAILFWFRVEFDGGAQVCTGPECGSRPHWQQTIFRLPTPRQCAPGQGWRIDLTFLVDRTRFDVTAQA